jgi:non-specific serine/threonine protein kinase
LIEGRPADAGFEGGLDLPAALKRAFQKSASAGLTCLASEECGGSLAAAFGFWRQFARRYFRAICRQFARDTRKWVSPAAPDDATLDEILDAAPPMLGLEYVSAHNLRALWRELDEYTATQVAGHSAGLADYLRRLDRNWNLIGRVTFHLAENKSVPDRPFAFLATFSEAHPESGAPQHRPLAEALKQSIASGHAWRLDELLEPVSRAAKTCPLIERLLDSRELFAPQAWTIGQAFEFLGLTPRMEEAGVVVRVPNWWNASRPPRPQVTVRIGTRDQPRLGLDQTLDFQVDVAIDGSPLSKAELAELLAAREGLALLRGQWVQVDQNQLEAALTHWKKLQKDRVGGVDFLEGMRLLAGVAVPGITEDGPAQHWTRIEAGDWMARTLAALRDPSDLGQIDPGTGLQATLRPYQAEGVRWLWFATQLGLGVCLADDMGLGKTIQVISLLLQLKQRKSVQPAGSHGTKSARQAAETPGPSLLVVPTSLLGNWKREVDRFAPDLKLFVAHRSVTDAETLAQVAGNPRRELERFDLVAITYGLARNAPWLTEANWRLVILDEAQAIKNAGAAQSRALKKIPARGRVMLTGTPVENHLGDLWSLFDFCSPGLLGTAAEFKKYVKASDERERSQRLAAIRNLIRPYVLRRMKTDPDVAPDLPAKTEIRVDCGLSPRQAALYAQIVDELKQSLDSASGIRRRGMVLAALMQLKQICNHASLYLKHANFAAADSGKYSELQAIAETLAEKQEKMLVFSQFQSMCGPLADFLGGVFQRSGLVLTGKTTPAQRSKWVAEFQEESGPPFFVISVKAGGTGLNLTQACHVVHFDRWWNPAVENQATDRAFRIGQKRNVMVHKFVCRGTMEERIDELIESKKNLSRELFDKEGELNLTEMSDQQLLRFVALDLNKAAIN